MSLNLLVLGLLSPSDARGADDPYATVVRPFLRGQCGGCHGAKSPAGGFEVETLIRGSASESLQARDRWERVAQRIQTGEMPPKGVARPDASQAKAVVGWIHGSYEALDRKTPVDPGRVTARRLNREEYGNSVRDLLGLDMNVGEELPVDPYGYGFDNIGDVLNVNAALTDRYLQAAEKMAHAAIPIDGKAPKPIMQRYLAERMGQDRQMRIWVDHAFPVDGTYTLRSGFFQGLPTGAKIQLRLFVDGKETASTVLVVHYQIDRGLESPEIHMTAGRHRIEATTELLPGVTYKGPPPYVEYIQVYGPLTATPAAETGAYKRFFTCGHAPGRHNSSCARTLLTPLARRAWRRPVTPAELDGLLGLAHREQSRTGSFEEAMRSSLMAILVSPHFLFRIEKDRGSGPQPLGGYELATRLSYYLWGSLPDEELLQAAEAGTLAKTVRQQAARMLRDPRAAAFVDRFAGQWLQTRNLSVLRPDVDKFPTFNGELAAAMRKETHLFFGEIVREDRSILDFLDGRFTYLNGLLAKHYGIAGVEGEEYRRVELDGAQRGGVLTHGSVLTVSSYPTRTSPVIRGKWVLDNLLNQPPPPPPPDIPALDEKAGPAAGTMRQQLEKHRANATCAGCHSRMDPLGFGLENYDAIGRWRTEEMGAPIDTSGELPGGATFRTPAELKSVLRADPDGFTRALTEKMLTFALGRGLDVRDRATVRKLADRVRANGYRMSELILGIVESEPFLMRRSEGVQR